MKKRGLVVGCLLFFSTLAPLVHAVDGISVEAGRSSESTNTFRLAAQFDFGQTLWQNQSGNVRLGGYWDAGVRRWSGLDATTVAISPVLRLDFGSPNSAMTPYIEAGIGASYFTRTDFDSENVDLGSKFQFEDRLGAGVRFADGSQLGLRVFHYSNAGIKSPNNGIETVSLHYRFDI